MKKSSRRKGKAVARRNIFTTYDISRHDSSSRHYGDHHQYNNHYYGGTNVAPMPPPNRHPQDRLEEYVSKGAAHNSLERGIDAPKCHPETREAVQENILSHIARGEEKVLWLSGPAGAGKTAIMGSIADECHARGWLAGSFFISKSAMKVDRCSKLYIIPTLAFHLLELIPGLREVILASIERNPSVFDKQLDHQVEVLILAPIRELCKTADTSEWPKAVLVDGVDECTADDGREYKTKYDRQESKEANHREVLSALVKLANDCSFPFRIVIASRPEHAIDEYFSSLPTDAVARVFLDEKYSPEEDIALYAEAMLTKIGRDCRLSQQWYSQVGKPLRIEDVPRHLAQQASGQFVYITTVIRYIQDKSNGAHKHKLLESVLKWRPANKSNPFSALDTLYLGILQTSPDPVLAVKWLRSLGILGVSSWYKKCVLEAFPGQTNSLIGPLQSLVRTEDERGEPGFHFYHKSLSDFLKDPKRCGAFHITDDDRRGFLAHRFLETLKNKGPQGRIPPGGILDEVLWWICFNIPGYIRHPHEKEYDTSHVDWWFSHLQQGLAEFCVNRAYGNVHKNCSSFSCLPTCKLWTECLEGYAREKGWDLPHRARFTGFRVGRKLKTDKRK